MKHIREYILENNENKLTSIKYSDFKNNKKLLDNFLENADTKIDDNGEKLYHVQLLFYGVKSSGNKFWLSKNKIAKLLRGRFKADKFEFIALKENS